MTDIKMPQMGESIAEGTIAVWLVEVGGYVAADQPLVQVSTDKADVDIPSPAAGVLSEIIAAEGATVPVGALIARIDETATAPKKEAAMPAPKEGPAEHPLRTEGFPAAEAMKVVTPEMEIQAPPEIKREEPLPRQPEGAPDMSAFYSSAVMRLSIEQGVDLRQVKGTGEGGRVTKADVMRAVEEGKAAAPGPAVPEAEASVPPAAPVVPPVKQPIPEEEIHVREGIPAATIVERPEEEIALAAHEGPEGFGAYHPPVYSVEAGDTDQPFTRLRRIIADHMVYSKRTSPHVTTFTETDLDKVFAFREKTKEKFKTETGLSLTYLPFVMLATVMALKEFPLMNSVVQGDSILIKKRINLGVAVDTERGLIVPVIRDAGDMGLMELARALDTISVRVREKKVMPDELAGGTFTVTNPGRKGNLFGTPIISQPQVGILRMGEVVKRAVVVPVDGEDAIVVRPMMYLSLSYDHRVVDGLTANEFLHRIKEHLEAGGFSL